MIFRIMSNKFGLIYKVTNKVNGKMYIGQTTRTLTKRRIEHLCHSKNSSDVFHKALRKYGASSFEWMVLIDNLKSKDLDYAEQQLIQDLSCDAMSKKGYNIRWGGSRGNLSKQSRKKLSDLKRKPKYIKIAMMNLPKNTRGILNGRFKKVNVESLAKDFENSIMSYRELHHKYGLSRPTIIRKVKEYFGDKFAEVRKTREKYLENWKSWK